jgi:type IV secretory pathway VirB2 component (pilin)
MMMLLRACAQEFTDYPETPAWHLLQAFAASAKMEDSASSCRSVAMADVIRFVLGNFTLTFLIIGLIATGIALARTPRPLSAAVIVEELFAYFLLFSIGFAFFYNFILHTFFGETAARFIGWAAASTLPKLNLSSPGRSPRCKQDPAGAARNTASGT